MQSILYSTYMQSRIAYCKKTQAGARRRDDVVLTSIRRNDDTVTSM